jgi:hypothetical protein
MAKSKKLENNIAVETEVKAETTSEQTEAVDSSPSLTELMDKMKKERKSYIRVKKLF